MDSRENRPNDEIDLVEYFGRLLAYWKLLLAAVLIGAVAAFFISRSLPKMYQSSATIYVQQSSAGSSLLKNLPGPLASSGGGTSGYLMTLLKSNTLLKRVINEFSLTKAPAFVGSHPKNMEDTIGLFNERLTVAENKTGSITVSLTAYDPELAANALNAMLDNLGTLVVTASTKKASFISQRLNETSRALEASEQALTVFLQKNDVADIEQQTKGMISQLGSLEASLLELDTQLSSVNSSLGNAGELDVLVDQEVKKKSLQASRDYVAKKCQELRTKLANLPEVAEKYSRIQRQIIILSKTYELLTEQSQLANITKKGEDGDYQIIDRATPNYKNVAPRTGMNTAAGAVCALMLAAMFAGVRDRLAMRRPRRLPPPPRSIPDVPTEETAKRT